jgi:endonuclease/exonuclease/phosphatase family metal-dependent hydrolase
MKNQVYLSAGLLAACALLAFSSAAAPAHPQPRQAAQVIPGFTPDALALLTFNMEHKDRPSELKIMANRLKADAGRLPDFVLCQEVVFNRSDESAPNTAAVLGNALGYYTRGTKRTSDNEGVAIISKYPFEYYGERHLKSQTSSLLLGFRRVSVIGEFLVPNIGRVRVVNAHFTNWGFEAHVRKRQLAETLEWAAQRDKQVPAVLTFLGGDFNMEVDWDEMAQLKSPQPGHLAFQDFNSDEPSHGLGSRRIDFVFVAPGEQLVRLADEKLLWRNGLERPDGSRFRLSDHVPVYHLYQVTDPVVLAAHNRRLAAERTASNSVSSSAD